MAEHRAAALKEEDGKILGKTVLEDFFMTPIELAKIKSSFGADGNSAKSSHKQLFSREAADIIVEFKKRRSPHLMEAGFFQLMFLGIKYCTIQ
jgi:hypothetical protein